MTKPKIYISAVASVAPNGISENGKYFSAVEPDYKTLIPNAALRRRMGRLLKMGVSAAEKCLQNIDNESIDAVITATGLGFLEDTEKFMESLLANDERLLNPTPFMQSTFNTIGGQIALLHKIQAYNVTHVHREVSFETALIDAELHFAEGRKNILLGAVDEFTPTSYEILCRLGVCRKATIGEGANFALLTTQKSNALAEYCGTRIFSIRKNSKKEILNFLAEIQIFAEKIDCVFSGGKTVEMHFPKAEKIYFKEICGEYFTATAFAFCCAAELLCTGTYRNVLILNKTEKFLSVTLLKRNEEC